MSGACSRLVSTLRLGAYVEQAPTWLEEIAKESSKHEEWVISDLQAQGLTIATCTRCPVCAAKGLERQGIHVEIDRPLYKLVGHLDGIIIEDTRVHGKSDFPFLHPLEIKGLSRFRYAAWLNQGFGGFPAFAAQVTCYMHAAEICTPPLVLIAKNRDTGQKDELQVGEAPVEIEEILEKYDWIEANARAGIVVSCDENPGSPVAKYCRVGDCPHRKE